MIEIELPEPKDPDFKGLIDEDILERFKDSNVFYSDIISAQQIKTNKELVAELKKQNDLKVIELRKQNK